MTTMVEFLSSVRSGHEAFFSSPIISEKNNLVFVNGFFMLLILAGEEGIEPPAYGFGDRRSAN